MVVRILPFLNYEFHSCQPKEHTTCFSNSKFLTTKHVLQTFLLVPLCTPPFIFCCYQRFYLERAPVGEDVILCCAVALTKKQTYRLVSLIIKIMSFVIDSDSWSRLKQ